MNWIKATETPPPFGVYVMLVMGRFADRERRSQSTHVTVARVMKDSPNDPGWGMRKEYAAFRNGEADYHEFQFYLQPIDKAWIGDTDLPMFDDFLHTYSDMISHWAKLPDLPDFDA